MRRESCTVVALIDLGHAGTGAPGAGPAERKTADIGASARVAEPLLAELGSSANISVVRPPAQDGDAVELATLALRQAAHRSSPFAVVPADPLADVARQWQAMWDISRDIPAGAVLFEEQAAHALGAWRAGRFELPDYYLVLAGTDGSRHGSRPRGAGHTGGSGTGASRTGASRTGSSGSEGSGTGAAFYLGPLRAVRPHRVVVAGGGPGTADGPEQAARVRDALRSLPHGPWWPPLDELLDTARRFFAGGLAEAGTTLATGPR